MSTLARMDQWRDGELSNAEMLGWLLSDLVNATNAIDEVRGAMYKAETKAADERAARLGIAPLTE